MKKIFEAEYGSDLADRVSEWILEQTDKDNRNNVFRPKVVVELFDQNGNEVVESLT